MITIIADDITGAAEIAGIAHRYGLRSLLSMTVPTATDGYDVIVIATDARSYGAQEAARMTQEIYALLPEDVRTSPLLFRKTDSALRGNVREELDALGGDFIYMPANPSKGRIIRDGIYYINEVPLADTDFRFDPEFPAFSSVISERLPGIVYANATTKADVDAVVNKAMAEGRRLAGAADLFASLIEHVYDIAPVAPKAFDGLAAEATMLVVCGSTQSRALDLGIRIESMPLDVFYGTAAPVTWSASIIDRYRRERSAIITIGDKEVRKGKDAAVYLRTAMAEVVCTLLAAQMPDELVIEGGATAFAILSQLPHKEFVITDEIAPGVVRMNVAGTATHITLKPGSYQWQGLFGINQTHQS